jgi:hypothetical protein
MDKSKAYQFSLWGLFGILGYLGFKEFYLINVIAYVGQQNIWDSKRYIAFLLISFLSITSYLVFGIFRIARIKSDKSIKNRKAPTIPRWIAAMLLVLLPGLIKWVLPLPQNFTFGYWEELFFIYSAALLASSLILKPETSERKALLTIAALAMAAGCAHAILLKLCQVTDYPFTLFWSEGNRFFDYSTLLGSNRYIFPGSEKIFAFISWGMQLPWAIPFIFPSLTIGAFRLWYQLVWVIPAGLLGWLAIRKKSASGRNGMIALIFAGWTFLFLDQGPIYPPLILAGLLTLLAVRVKLPIGAILVISASYYARQARWTWSYSPGLWAGMLALLAESAPDFSKAGLKKLIRPIVLGLSGYVGGQILPFIINSLSNSGASLLPDVVRSTTRQPLLWNRLYPNPTYPPGILYGLLWASLPLIVLILALVIKRAWKINWLQGLAMTAIAGAFLTVGTIASVKIGGGSNLHNLDNFLVTLVLISAAAVNTIRDQHDPSAKHPLLILLTCLALIAPVTYSLQGGARLNLPAQETTHEVMENLTTIVDTYKDEGEILFMDQRQLLTFGMVEDVPLVDEYEKKYLMDQAMADNGDYFESFYQDLQAQRFVLIVNEPSNYIIRGSESSFGEENDAYVKWVTIPLLCTYEPIYTSADIGVELLVPRPSQPTEAICQDYPGLTTAD